MAVGYPRCSPPNAVSRPRIERLPDIQHIGDPDGKRQTYKDEGEVYAQDKDDRLEKDGREKSDARKGADNIESSTMPFDLFKEFHGLALPFLSIVRWIEHT